MFISRVYCPGFWGVDVELLLGNTCAYAGIKTLQLGRLELSSKIWFRYKLVTLPAACDMRILFVHSATRQL